MKKIIILLILVMINSLLFSNDLSIERTIGEIYQDVELAILKDELNPELPKLDYIIASGACSVEKYKDSTLEIISESYQQLTAIFIVYAKFSNIYCDEFSYITSNLIRIMDILVDKSIILRENSEEGYITVIQGFGEVLVGGIQIFTSIDELPDKNRLEIAIAVLGVTKEKWEILPLTRKSEIIATLEGYRKKEKFKKITNVVDDFLKNREFKNLFE